MKFIEKLTLVLFSIIMMALSVIACLLVFGWLDIVSIGNFIEKITLDTMYSNILLVISVIFILLSIRCIFFRYNDNEKNEYKNGILLENAEGKLLITKETIENLVNRVVNGFDSAENVTTKIEVDKENLVKIYVNLNVRENAIIKELVVNMQNKIKETIKKMSDLEVKEVNIKVKNLEPEKEAIQE